MTSQRKHFVKDEKGAVTVDWVVLTGIIVGLGIAITAALKPGLIGSVDRFDDNVSIGQTF